MSLRPNKFRSRYSTTTFDRQEFNFLDSPIISHHVFRRRRLRDEQCEFQNCLDNHRKRKSLGTRLTKMKISRFHLYCSVISIAGSELLSSSTTSFIEDSFIGVFLVEIFTRVLIFENTAASTIMGIINNGYIDIRNSYMEKNLRENA